MNRCIVCSRTIVERHGLYCSLCDHISSSCSTCGSRGLCAADCSLAPWNFELVVGEIALKYPAPSRFAYLLRQRRWAGSPIDLRDIFFVEDRGRR